MTANLQKINDDLSSTFKLQNPLVALAFVDQPPEGTPIFEGESPSLCRFWNDAKSRVFFAPKDKHMNCPIGAMVMGFELSEEKQQELELLVNQMCNSSYLDPEEASAIPSIIEGKDGILYGPLKDFPIQPQLILMWLTPFQTMVFNEAMGSCKWNNELKTLSLGRPGCAIIPTSLQDSKNSVSFGCIGMRTFTEVSDEFVLSAIPFKNVDAFIKDLKITSHANNTMLKYYSEQKKKYPNEVSGNNDPGK
jgi:uncharacterized protein (DUF169 family)